MMCCFSGEDRHIYAHRRLRTPQAKIETWSTGAVFQKESDSQAREEGCQRKVSQLDLSERRGRREAHRGSSPYVVSQSKVGRGLVLRDRVGNASCIGRGITMPKGGLWLGVRLATKKQKLCCRGKTDDKGLREGKRGHLRRDNKSCVTCDKRKNNKPSDGLVRRSTRILIREAGPLQSDVVERESASRRGRGILRVTTYHQDVESRVIEQDVMYSCAASLHRRPCFFG